MTLDSLSSINALVIIFHIKGSLETDSLVGEVAHLDIASVVKDCRSRSGSPATCYDMTKFEKEKSPFLAVKSLLKPLKRSRVPEQSGDSGESSSPSQAPDWRKLPGMLKPRGSLQPRLKLRNKVDTQTHSLLSPGLQIITMVQCHKTGRNPFFLNVLNFIVSINRFSMSILEVLHFRLS